MNDLKSKLLTVKGLFEALFTILLTEGDHEVNYACNELKNDVGIILDAVSNQAADLSQTFSQIKESYQSMYPPHGGLTDFFIWRDDFDERVKANQPLDKIQEALKAIFS